jgi:hypothetical protein
MMLTAMLTAAATRAGKIGRRMDGILNGSR